MLSSADAASDLAAVLARCALGDQAALVALYQACSAKLYGIALRIVKRESLAEEVLQEGFIKVWLHAASYNPSKGTPMIWMINIIRNQSLDLLRQPEYRLREQAQLTDEGQFIDRNNPLADVEISDELLRLLRCLKGLSKPQRQCILALYHQGFTPSEAAYRLSLPLATVKTWMRRGLQMIRECLRR